MRPLFLRLSCVFLCALSVSAAAREIDELQNRTFDGSAAKPSLDVPTPAAASAPPAEALDAPIPAEELGRYIHLRGAVGFDPDRELTRKKRAFLHDVLERVQRSAEGRRLLRELIEEYRLAGGLVSIGMSQGAGSRLRIQDGVPKIVGSWTAISDADRYSVELNDIFLRFPDRQAALDTATESLSHELRHLSLDAWVRRNAPRFYEIVFRRDLANEQSARLRGYLVQMELAPDRANQYTESIRSLASSPARYWEELKLIDPKYALKLDGEEMKDPVNAYRRRREALKAEQEDLRHSLAVRVPRILAQIGHFESVHGLGRPLAGLRASTEVRLKVLPEYIQEIDDTLRALDSRLAELSSPRGAADIELMREAASDSKYATILESLRADEEKLRRLVREKGLPIVEGEPGQLRSREFFKLLKRDQKNNPSHWNGDDPR